MIVQNHARTIATQAGLGANELRKEEATRVGRRNMSSNASYFPIQGHCDDRFAAVRAAFEANFQRGADIGASVVLIKDGETLVDLWGGAKDADRTQPWERDTVVAVASTT